MLSNPYTLPRGRRHILHVSGGRTSGYLLRHILDAHGGQLPPHARAIFTNTGKEREETLVFLREIGRRWNVEITWLEYDYRKHAPGGRGGDRQKNWFRVVDFDTASRQGEPFAALIRSRRMLPNAVTRLCTEELKINTTARYVRHVLHWARPRRPKPLDVLGIRSDEPKRISKALWEECRSRYPLVNADVTEADVDAWWDDQPFDLALRKDEGNCDLCFLKGARKLKWLINDAPERADWWIEQERFRAEHSRKACDKPESQRFRPGYSYADLKTLTLLPFDLPDEDDGISCFCGD